MVSTEPHLETSYQHCVQLARQSGSNFFWVFSALPRPLFRDMCALYAYMRITDDLGDESSCEAELQQEKLQAWREQMYASLDGESVEHPVLHALSGVAHRHSISKDLLDEVIQGVITDLQPVNFKSFDELNEYCYQVAGSVGLCCLKIWGCQTETPEIEQMAIDCGTAFQLTNILRDIGEDASNGRVYIPENELKQFGLERSDLLNQAAASTALDHLMQFQIERAWQFYRRSILLVEKVPKVAKPILSGFFAAYSSLLHQVAARGGDVFSAPVQLSRFTKWKLAACALLRVSCKISLPEN